MYLILLSFFYPLALFSHDYSLHERCGRSHLIEDDICKHVQFIISKYQSTQKELRIKPDFFQVPQDAHQNLDWMLSFKSSSQTENLFNATKIFHFQMMMEYFEAKIQLSARYTQPLPKNKMILNEGFNLNHPETRIHTGVDLEGRDPSTGSLLPVYAINWGMVVYAQWDMVYGKTIVIAHPDGYISLYAHLSVIDRELIKALHSTPSLPIFVKPGMQIGITGSTGHSTGDHLHFEMRRLKRIKYTTMSSLSLKAGLIPSQDFEEVFYPPLTLISGLK